MSSQNPINTCYHISGANPSQRLLCYANYNLKNNYENVCNENFAFAFRSQASHSICICVSFSFTFPIFPFPHLAAISEGAKC